MKMADVIIDGFEQALPGFAADGIVGELQRPEITANSDEGRISSINWPEVNRIAEIGQALLGVARSTGAEVHVGEVAYNAPQTPN